MTAYQASFTTTSGTTVAVALRAGAYELRVTHLWVTDPGQTELVASLTLWTSATTSGGNIVPVAPFRQGAPATAATVRSGAVTTSGSSSVLLVPYFVSKWVPEFDFTIAPGSALVATYFSTASSGWIVGVTFEELLLAWHY